MLANTCKFKSMHDQKSAHQNPDNSTKRTAAKSQNKAESITEICVSEAFLKTLGNRPLRQIDTTTSEGKKP
jgi:hypothetical protein